MPKLWIIASNIVVVACMTISVPAQTPRQPAPVDLPHGVQWTPTRGDASQMDSAALDALYRDMAAEEHHDLKGIVILRDGSLVSEHYFNGDSADTLHDIRSATKSITSLLLGIAIDQGKVHGVDDLIARYLPGLPHDGKEKIRIEDLLTMRSGLDADDTDPSTPGNEDRLDESTDWIRTVYAVPMRRAPGERYLYTSINAFLAGATVENGTGESLDEFARTYLFAPLNIKLFHWRHVPVKRTTGQGNLEITARDAAALGQLILNDGVVDGRRLVSHAWLEKSTASLVPIGDSDPYADSYGYMWYTKAEQVGADTIVVHFASGNGGNKIYIVPSCHMAIAITSSAYGTRWGQRRSQDILRRILAATTCGADGR
ncbi:CubicO group peptidase, beta-lactamase class C family [Granulicella rosea]|uniref:CubicO group peptidase, beta-lactamase class C family n=1 Tax=Granulicella rosea TaxID=474952 RepID=A0A239E8D8_9BACT|nr:serine hydrolase [Granulicella rosea]SNS40558.1 CubicO group peptidase, beta-lactamase class C family [Granulicella rosea]